MLWVSGIVSKTQHEISPVHTVTSMWILVLKETPETSNNDARRTIRSLILGTVKVIFLNAQSRSGVCKLLTRRTPWMKPPGRETGLFPPSSVDVKNSGAVYIILLQAVMAWAETKCLNAFAGAERPSVSGCLIHSGQPTVSTLHKHTRVLARQNIL